MLYYLYSHFLSTASHAPIIEKTTEYHSIPSDVSVNLCWSATDRVWVQTLSFSLTLMGRWKERAVHGSMKVQKIWNHMCKCANKNYNALRFEVDSKEMVQILTYIHRTKANFISLAHRPTLLLGPFLLSNPLVAKTHLQF